MRPDPQRAHAVLLVDDNPGDLELCRMAMEERGIDVPVLTAFDGEEAHALLLRLAEAGGLPRLALIDLNMPRVDGWQLLARLRDPRFAGMHRLAFTSSSAPHDHQRALALGAEECVVKPDSYFGLLEVIEGLRRYLDGSGQHPRLDATRE